MLNFELDQKYNRVILFGFFCCIVYAIAILLLNSSYYLQSPKVIGAAIAVDLTFTLSAFYFFVVAKRQINKTIPVFIISNLVCYFVFPEQYENISIYTKYVIFFVELFVFIKVVKLFTWYKKNAGALNFNQFMDAIKKELNKKITSDRILVILLNEIKMMTALIFPFKSSEKGYSIVHNSGYSYIFSVLTFLFIIETFVLHIVLENYSLVAAWIVTFLGSYSFLFLVSDYRLLSKIPFTIDNDKLKISVGLRYFAEIRYDQIKSVSKKPIGENSHFVNTSLLISSNTRIQFKTTQYIESLFGKKIACEGIDIYLNDHDQCIREINTRVKCLTQ